VLNFALGANAQPGVPQPASNVSGLGPNGTLSAKGKVIPFFGLELPPLIGADKALGRSLEDVHTTIGTFGYYLIGLHAAAALFHHYIVHDNTLRRMLPHRRRSLAG